MICSASFEKAWTRRFIILGASICLVSCSRKPQTVPQLFSEAVFDEKARTKQFVVTAAGTDPLMDDFEDGDLNGLKRDGRNWNWSQFDDMSDGIQYLTLARQDDAPAVGKGVLYVKGGDWRKWGAGLSAKLTDKTEPRSYGVYDASAYSGIRFWAKAEGLNQLKISIGTPETTPVDEGGVCLQNDPGHFSTSVTVGNNWLPVQIPFNEFRLTRGKHSLPLDGTRIKSIRFTFETLGDYEVWLDDFGFIKE